MNGPNAPATGADVLAIIAKLAVQPFGDQDATRPWIEIGIDSFSATELLIQLEEALGEVDDRSIEIAFFSAGTPMELLERLADMGGIR